jgi:hypothetical protein
MKEKIYVTTFCNFGHRLSDGKPVDHECYILSPAALRAEREGDYERAIELQQLAWKKSGRRIHKGLKVARRNPSKRRLLRDLPSRQREMTINNTVVASWHERDRDYIELMWKDTEETILEAWDEDYRGLVEDGFIDPRPRRLHLSLIEYARHMGLAR